MPCLQGQAFLGEDGFQYLDAADGWRYYWDAATWQWAAWYFLGGVAADGITDAGTGPAELAPQAGAEPAAHAVGGGFAAGVLVPPSTAQGDCAASAASSAIEVLLSGRRSVIV